MVHIAAEGAEEFIENKIAKKIVKSKPLRDENLKNAEEIVNTRAKRKSNKRMNKNIIKWNIIKYLNY